MRNEMRFYPLRVGCLLVIVCFLSLSWIKSFPDDGGRSNYFSKTKIIVIKKKKEEKDSNLIFTLPCSAGLYDGKLHQIKRIIGIFMPK